VREDVTGYGDDLAHIHARGFTSLAEEAAPVIVRLLGPPRGTVVDLGCGSGVTTRALVEAGHDVLAVDTSAAMLELAARAAPGASFVRSSALELELPANCAAVLAVGEVLNYVEEDLGPLYARVAGALSPGGLFVFDLAGPGRIPGGGPVRHWTEGDDWAVLVETEEDPVTAVLTRRMTTFREAGGAWRRGHETHRQRLHRPTDVAGRLRELGLRVRIRRGYAGKRFAARHFVVIANLPARDRV
jgi:SAM-dependent methyltransferase